MALEKLKKIEKYLNKIEEPEFRYKQILNWVFRKKTGNWNNMINIPISLRLALKDRFGDNYLTIHPSNIYKSKQAIKVVFELNDQKKIETVFMRFKNKKSWNSICISSQVGCALNCKFCATGIMGFVRNLITDEIIEQILYFHLNKLNINSFSFMGMGEPLLNPNIFNAINVLIDKNYFNISQRKISISTVGIVSKLRELIYKFPQINISYSLHTPFEYEREKLMPGAAKYKIMSVFNLLNKHSKLNKRKIFISYIMLNGINDTNRHLNALIKLIKKQYYPRLFHVNLIRYNKISNSEFTSSSKNKINSFMKKLKLNGINSTFRQSFGYDINAACGQLIT